MYEIMEPDHGPEARGPKKSDDVCDCSCNCGCAGTDQALQGSRNTSAGQPDQQTHIQGLER